MVVPKGSELHTPSLTRILEALIIAGVTAGVVLYGTGIRQEEQIKSLKEQVVLQIAPIKEDMAWVKQAQHAMTQEMNNVKIEIARIKK